VYHAVDDERLHEVYLHLASWLQDAVADAVVAADAAVAGADGDVEVVESEIPPDAPWRRERASQSIRPGERSRFLGGGRCEAGDEEREGGKRATHHGIPGWG
jgi:hypothetical protein